MDLLAELQRLEERLLALGQECDTDCVESLLAPEFVEFGASGRVWTREAMLAELNAVGSRDFSVSDVACNILGPDAALLTYRVAVGHRKSLRSSVWVRRDGRWQVAFHQGTLAAE